MFRYPKAFQVGIGQSLGRGIIRRRHHYHHHHQTKEFAMNVSAINLRLLLGGFVQPDIYVHIYVYVVYIILLMLLCPANFILNTPEWFYLRRSILNSNWKLIAFSRFLWRCPAHEMMSRYVYVYVCIVRIIVQENWIWILMYRVATDRRWSEP